MKILSTDQKTYYDNNEKNLIMKKAKRGHSETGMSKYKYRCFTWHIHVL